MSRKRVFTDEELKNMSMRTADAAIQAVDAGDKERAKKLIARLSNEFRWLHDVYVDWSADLMDHIYSNEGEEAFNQAMRKAVSNYMGPLTDSYNKADFKHQVIMAATGLRGHLNELEIEEDEEKITIKMKPCGSGQRLVESGAYGPPRNLARLKPSPMTYGLSEFPVYCAHSPIQEMVSIEKIGYPTFPCVPAEPIGNGLCKFLIYKDPKAIPEKIYTRVGKKKPK